MSKKKGETFNFQSEVQQLLHILVYSLYKNKEVFLRELISNAVDALNKVRFEILAGRPVADPEAELQISISTDSDRGLLIVEDSGIGMSRDELIENIGTIARSGTMEYLRRISESREQGDLPELIGRFGVGFYASFMVSKEIRLHTRSLDPEALPCLWRSSGGETYTIETAEPRPRGTRIELVLKKDDKEFLESSRLKAIIRKHAKFAPFPILLNGEKIETAAAIWTQPRSSLKDSDYQDFYRFFSGAAEDAASYLHLTSDAPVQFQALLYIPGGQAGEGVFLQGDPQVDIYSRRVLIHKGSKEMMPEYLRFVRGLVDSEEIPLNISRESIQDNLRIDKIRRHLVRKLIDHLKQIKDRDLPAYTAIWRNWGRLLKEGVISDYDNRDRLAELLLFHSSKTGPDSFTDLKTLADGLPDGEKEIYYLSGSDYQSLLRNPALEAFRKKDLEVLFLLDPLDEFSLSHLRSYQNREFKLAESSSVQLDQAPEKAENPEIKDLVAYLEKLYGPRVAGVRISKRLHESPAILVHDQQAPSRQMEKMIKMVDRDYQFSKRILEINPDHGLIIKLAARLRESPENEDLAEIGRQLLDNLLLREGLIEDLEETISRMQRIMSLAAR